MNGSGVNGSRREILVLLFAQPLQPRALCRLSLLRRSTEPVRDSRKSGPKGVAAASPNETDRPPANGTGSGRRFWWPVNATQVSTVAPYDPTVQGNGTARGPARCTAHRL